MEGVGSFVCRDLERAVQCEGEIERAEHPPAILDKEAAAEEHEPAERPEEEESFTDLREVRQNQQQ